MIKKQPRPLFTLWEALFPFAVSVFLLVVSNYCWHVHTELLNACALLLGACVALLLSWRRGISPRRALNGVLMNIQPILPTLWFLLLIGAVSVAWVLGGIIPASIYYGIKYLSPKFFLVAVTLFSAAMGIACGSSWLTVATMGVAFLSIGNVLGFPGPLVAGAIISGAYFGDKLTPLSETTVLAASMTQTPLLKHVRYMLWTSIPTFIVSLGMFYFLGREYGHPNNNINYQTTLALLEENFSIRAAWLLVPFAMIVLTGLGVSPIFTLSIGVLLGLGIAFYAQPVFLGHVTQESMQGSWQKLYFMLKKTFWGIEVAHKNPIMKKLLCRYGILGMWSTLMIILASLTLSGVMEGTGLLDTLVSKIKKRPSNTSLILMSTATAIFFNLTVADQYLAIILTSKIFTPLFAEQGLASENTSRAVEDAATVTSPLITWNTCGTMQAKVLGIPTMSYLPYCFFNLLSPAISILFMACDIKIAKAKATCPASS